MAAFEFIKVNGWQIPVAAKSGGNKWIYAGGAVTKTDYNSPQKNRVRRMQVAEGETCVMGARDATTLEALLVGMCHHWDFSDDLWSFCGIGPNAGFSVVRDPVGGPFGNGSITPTDITWTFPRRLRLGRRWTVSVWRDTGAGYLRWDIRSDGAVFVNGVRDDTQTTSFLVVDQGALRLTGGDDFADLSVYRFEACDEYLQQNYAWQASLSQRNPDMPYLTVQGSQFEDQVQLYTASGATASQNVVEAGSGNALRPWRNNVRKVPYEITVTALPTVPAVVTLAGGLLISGYMESPEMVLGGFSDKGAGAPSSPITISGMPTTEWGYLLNYTPSGDVGWVRTLEGVNGVAGSNNRCFVAKLLHKAGEASAYFAWFSQADDVEVRDENGSLVETYNRPPNSGPGSLVTFWGGVTSIDVATGAINWTTIADWDIPITTNTFDLRPITLAFGGVDEAELVAGFLVTAQKASAPIPTPIYGTTVQASYPTVDFARVGASSVSGAWLVKINKENGDAVSSTATAANLNDDIASAGTPNRGFNPTSQFNIFNILWNPVTELWYMSANHSGYSTLNVDGHIIGRTKAGEIPTRGTDNFGGVNSVKPYICTYDNNDFQPQNVVTLVCNTLNDGNNRYAYNHSVFLVEDGSGDVFWGWQNMSSSPAVNLQREGILGNYGGGQYNVTNNAANDSIAVRLNTDLEVVWEVKSFGNADAGLGRGHSVQMTTVPNEPSRMMAMVSTHGTNSNFNVSTELFDSSPTVVNFDARQSFFVKFDIATGLFVDERELERAATAEKMVAIGQSLAPSGPLVGKTFAAVLMSNSVVTTVQGFYDSAGVRQYNTADYWNSNGAVHAAGSSGAIHLVAYDADGELDPANSYPLVSIEIGTVANNQWAVWTVPY